MRKNKVRMLIIFVALLAMAGACTKVSFKPLDAGKSYDKTEQIKLFKNYPDVPYEEIGTLRAVGPSKDKLLDSIREKAMKVGAQAIVVKPVAKRSNTYEAQRLNKNFGKEEYIMEAVALRFKTTGN